MALLLGETIIANTTTQVANMTGATSATAGSAGSVPAPAAGQQNYHLSGAGIWVDARPYINSDTSSKLYVLGATGTGNQNIYRESSVYMTGDVLYGAAWNDYAEFRECIEMPVPGRVVCEKGNDTLVLATERLQPGAAIVSDTYGFAIGQTEEAQTPIAVSGRVLAYPYEDRITYLPGDAVCAAPNGTVSKMTREEIREYPERIVGTVSAVPTYETWGQNNIKVNGRIWIKVR